MRSASVILHIHTNMMSFAYAAQTPKVILYLLILIAHYKNEHLNCLRIAFERQGARDAVQVLIGTMGWYNGIHILNVWVASLQGDIDEVMVLLRGVLWRALFEGVWGADEVWNLQVHLIIRWGFIGQWQCVCVCVCNNGYMMEVLIGGSVICGVNIYHNRLVSATEL